MKADVCEKTIAYGRNQYRVDKNDNWLCLVFGTTGPQDNGIPRYSWIAIPKERVPAEVRACAKSNA